MFLKLLLLFGILLLFTCSKKIEEKNLTTPEKLTIPKSLKENISKKKAVSHDSILQDTVSKSKSNSKLSKLHKDHNPIHTIAMENSLFNAKKWLQSDYSFFHRKKPTQISVYDPTIKKFARRYGFDWRLIAAQIYAESNFKELANSKVGAKGLMQIMPNTAKFLGFDPQLIIKPELNIAIGCMYDQRLYNLWGRQTQNKNRLAFALASYNAGRGRVLKNYCTEDSLTTWQKVHPFLPKETQSYVHKIYLKHAFYKKYFLP